jgi:hypothetical protein
MSGSPRPSDWHEGRVPARRTLAARDSAPDDALAAYVAAAGSVPDAAAPVGIRPSTTKRHLADLRARTGPTTVELIYAGRADGWLMVQSLESHGHLFLLCSTIWSSATAPASPRENRASRSTARAAARRRSR